jgi:hypothetical protein
MPRWPAAASRFWIIGSSGLASRALSHWIACARPLPAPGPAILSFQRPKGGAHKQTQLGFAELAAEIVEARGDSSQPRHAFQNGFVPQRLKFFTQFVGDLPKACLQDFQGRARQRPTRIVAVVAA